MHSIPPVFHAIVNSRHTIKRPGEAGREKFHRRQHVGHHDVHVKGHTWIAMLLHRQSANNQVRNVMFRQ